jgi:hypothetical protein
LRLAPGLDFDDRGVAVPDPPDINVNISLSPEALDQIGKTVGRLERAGLQIEVVMGAIGIITGRVASSKIRRISRVQGITVEIDRSIGIPPPDSPIQ